MNDLLPLNGTKTHPLSRHAKAALDLIRKAPIPAQEINPGVVNRLLREGVVELCEMPSPYKGRRRTVSHLRLKAQASQTAGSTKE